MASMSWGADSQACLLSNVQQLSVRGEAGYTLGRLSLPATLLCKLETPTPGPQASCRFPAARIGGAPSGCPPRRPPTSWPPPRGSRAESACLRRRARPGAGTDRAILQSRVARNLGYEQTLEILLKAGQSLKSFPAPQCSGTPPRFGSH